MTVYDTFETENYSTYSGSYNARVMYGNFFSDIASGNRVCIADRVSGIISSSLYDARNTYLTSFALGIISGSYIGHNTRHLPLQCDSEIYVDSCMISPIYYNLRNGAASVIDEVPFSGSTRFNIPFIRETGSINLLVGEFVGTPVSIPEGNGIIDEVWKYSYPFMSKYKGLARTFRQSYNAPYSIETNITRSNEDNLAYDSPNGPFYSNRVGQLWLGSFGKGTATRIGLLYDFAFVSGAWGRINTSPGNIRIFQSLVWDRDPLFSPRIEETNKAYFGVGPQRTKVATYGLGEINLAFGAIFAIVNPILRGWKYGILNGNRTSSKCIYRTGHYGHLRDMLEQRLFSKVFDEETGKVLGAPVSVTPVSGTTLFANSIDYVTATNPDYNPRDSGAWDYEYKSGQPYFDP